jgi:DNA-binding MarR family transcriptional regulator
MMRALADDLSLSPRNMTALVDSLEAEGLVARRPHPTDRRATIVELTGAGMTAAEDTLEPRLAAIGELFDDLNDRERAQFAMLLAKLVAGLSDRCTH